MLHSGELRAPTSQNQKSGHPSVSLCWQLLGFLYLPHPRSNHITAVIAVIHTYKVVYCSQCIASGNPCAHFFPSSHSLRFVRLKNFNVLIKLFSFVRCYDSIIRFPFLFFYASHTNKQTHIHWRRLFAHLVAVVVFFYNFAFFHYL